ncbi:hypothetical protein AB0I54_28365 [Streptomyces sp. NPDC050625]|uniref:hypothetical protein n=1 Tax=Streptomyces sp. NPDC050625 TaxID=3154629 RepID=UPI0034486888
MTPFMLSVIALLEGERATEPATEPSRSRAVAEATDTQVLVRSLAEQLVCEANAILREHGTTFSLVDEAGPGNLAFTIGFGDSSARVQTEVHGHTAVGRLIAPGLPDDEPLQLTTEDELQSLLLSLITTSPRP